jgi:cytochrome c-type biogenesis protein CcmH
MSMRTMLPRALALLLLLGALGALPGAAGVGRAGVGTAALQAQQPQSEAELEAMVRSLAAQLRCPVCQGVSIQDSPTELAHEMKDVIRQQLREGKSPEEVKTYFTDRYGEWVLLQPKPEGFNLVVYILPVVILLVGTGFVYKTIQRWSHEEPSELHLGSEDDPAKRRRR